MIHPLVRNKSIAIIVIGVGRCGCAIINKMVSSEYTGVTYIAVDSDSTMLNACKAEQKIFIPEAVLLDGAEQELRERLASIPDAHMAFVVSGMGGITGTKISPIIAEYVMRHQTLVIGATTSPLPDEGEQRMATAEKGLSIFLQSANSVIVIPMAELLSRATPPLKMKDIYHKADRAIIIGIESLVDTITRRGLIGVDFMDIKAVLENGGISHVGYGTATGKERARQAATRAIFSPMLGVNKLKRALGLILIIVGDNDVSLDEVSEVNNIISDCCNDNAQILFQSFYDGKAGELSAIIIGSIGRSSAKYISKKSDIGNDDFIIDDYELDTQTFIRHISSFGN
jgi:cell division protein FtsZ